jgi:ABC-type nitrate/sulfonate/bicarbonate transport system ATPase subunit
VTHNTHEAVYLGTRVVALAKDPVAGAARVAMDIETHEDVEALVREIEHRGVPVEA